MPRITVKHDICLAVALALLLVPFKWIVAWLLAVFIHEAGHYLALRSFGIPVYGIRFDATGVCMETTSLAGVKGVVCILAGPVFGLLLLSLGRWFPLLAICGFLQSVVNFLPLYPLDGGRLLLCLLERFPQQYCQRIVQGVEALVLAVAFMAGFYLTFVRLLGGIPLLAAVFLIHRRKLSCKLQRQRVQ